MSLRNILRIITGLVVLVLGIFFKKGILFIGNNVLTYTFLTLIIIFFASFAKKKLELSDTQKKEIKDAEKKYPFVKNYPMRDSLSDIYDDLKKHAVGTVYIYSTIAASAAIAFFSFVFNLEKGGEWGILALALPLVFIVCIIVFIYALQGNLNTLVYTKRVKLKLLTISKETDSVLWDNIMKSANAYIHWSKLSLIFMGLIVIVGIVGIVVS